MYAPKGSVYSRGKVPPNTPGWLAGELSALRSAFANSMEAIDTLKNDRDKLKSQVETLQQQLSSFTRGPSGHRSSYGSTPGGQTIYQPPEDTSLGGATPAYTEAQTKEGWNVEVQETWGSGGTWGDASTMQSTNDAPTGRHTNEAAVADPTHAGARQATSSSHVASDSSRSHRRRSGGHKSAKGGQDIDANALADCDVDKVFVQQPKQLETIRNVAVKVCVSELKNFWSHYVEPGLIRRKAAVSHVQNLHKTLRDRVFKIEEHVNMKHPPEGPGEAIPDSATSEQPGSVASLQPLPLPAPPEQEASTGDTDMTATN